MGQPYLGEIRATAFNFPPRGWALCNGQLLAIQTNQALFAILGTTYGGNGQTTFALPNLQGRVALHFGQGPGLANYNLGQVGGEYNHTLTISEMPAHNHQVFANGAPSTVVATPTSDFWAKSNQTDKRFDPNANGLMNAAAIGTSGNSQPHPNVQPYLVINFIIALQGIFPSHG